MKADRLESFVNENRHEFDHMEPPDKIWDSISSQLNEQPKRLIRKFTCVQIAAMLAVILLVPTIVYQIRLSDQKQTAKSVQIDPDVQELMEAEAFYAQEVSGKLAEIQKCYQVHPEIKPVSYTHLRAHETRHDL